MKKINVKRNHVTDNRLIINQIKFQKKKENKGNAKLIILKVKRGARVWEKETMSGGYKQPKNDLSRKEVHGAYEKNVK